MSRSIFLTGRRKLKHGDLFLSIWDDAGGFPVIKVDLRLDKYKLPAAAIVTVDAYSTVYYQRMSLGSVGEWAEPKTVRLEEMSKGDRPVFRVKVTDHVTGRLLAANDRVVPIARGTPAENQRCILPIEWKSNEEMGGEVWRVNLVDKVLLLNNDVPGLFLQTQQHDPRFESFVLPAALREVLRQVFITDDEDLDEESEWFVFARSILSDNPPERHQDDDIYRSEKSDWIDNVVRRFCEKQQYFQRLTQMETVAESEGES